MQVTTFTIAHSITLALAMLGESLSPRRIVEPMIAASIALVAVENPFADCSTTRRLAVVFACGLLHGLGFAGVLTERVSRRRKSAAALVGFNAGVEFGQLSVVGAAWLAAVIAGAAIGAGAGWPDADSSRLWSSRAPSLALALAGVVWTVERLTSA